MRFLKASASPDILIGPLVDYQDGVTPVTAPTLAGITCNFFNGVTASSRTLVASGATGTQRNFVHVADGYFKLTLVGASDIASPGPFRVELKDVDVILPVWAEFWIVPSTLYDVLTVEGTLNKMFATFTDSSGDRLQDYLTALASKAASKPSTMSGTYDPSTDSLEKASEDLANMRGSGFNTTNDSLYVLRQTFDNSVTPNIVAASSLSGSGFLSDSVSLIRKMVDEPSTNAKYNDNDMVEFLEAAFATTIADLNAAMDHPILVRYSISVVTGTQNYILPPHVAEVWRVAKINSTTGLPDWEVWPGSEHSFSGRGFSIEGNTLRLLSDWKESQTLEILYVPMAETSIHKGSVTTPVNGTTTLTLATTPTDGSLDTRVQAYAGYVLRILPGNGGDIVQERIITDYDNSTRIATVNIPFSPTLSGNTTYEVVPQYSRLLKHVVCSQAAMDILASEGQTKRLKLLDTRHKVKNRSLRMNLEKKISRFLHSMNSDTIDNEEKGYPIQYTY